MKRLILCAVLLFASTALANRPQGDLLIQVTPEMRASLVQFSAMTPNGSQVEDLQFGNWVRVNIPENKLQSLNLVRLKSHPGVLHIQPNYRISLLDDYSINSPRFRRQVSRLSEDCPIPIPGFCDDDGGDDGGGFPWPGDPGDGGGDENCPIPIPGFCDGNGGGGGNARQDNPEIPSSGSGGSGADPLFSKQWGMNDIGVKKAWEKGKGSQEMVVAVIDTGVDYTHEDLIDNMWRNPGETGTDSQGRDKATNGVDDDGNGFVDDTIGWDFVTNDNKPFDLSVDPADLMIGGGNPGHGTHCAGNVAARGDNGKGIAGVAPNVKIMALRFLSEKGQGTTADAIKAVRYAVDNGAKVLSNSWGSEGEDPNDSQGNKALRDIITYAEQNGSLFVAAAGNGHNGVGYNNDSDPRPAYPASYDMDTIISVAAIDNSDNLGSFSNWGPRTVDIGAPGVKVFSTTVDSKYDDKVAEFFGTTIYWDGTSMATPHVAGAAALYWSANPDKTWREVKDAILNSARKTSTLNTKVVSGGKLDVEALMNQ